MISRRQSIIVAVTLVIVLVVSGISLQIYTDQRRRLIESVSEAEFVVTSIDILRYTERNVTMAVEIRTDFVIPSTSGDATLDVTLEYQGEELTTFVLTPEDIAGSSSQIVLTLPIDILQGRSDFFNSLLSSIFDGRVFNVTMYGTVHYSFLGVKDTLDFTNRLYFDLEERFTFDLSNFVLPERSELWTNVTVGIGNPWSVFLELNGTVDFKVGSVLFGTVVLDDLLTLVSGQKNYTVPFLLPDYINQTLGAVLSSENQSISLEISVNIFVGTVVQHIDLVVPVETNTTSAFEIKELQELSEQDGMISLRFDLLLRNPLPASFNLRSLRLEVETVTGSIFLGVMHWNTTVSLRVLPEGLVEMRNVSGLFRSDRQTFFRVLQDGAVSIRSGVLVLDLYGELVSIYFSIPVLKF